MYQLSVIHRGCRLQLCTVHKCLIKEPVQDHICWYGQKYAFWYRYSPDVDILSATCAGTIPSALCNWRNLLGFTLTDQYVSGSIPSCVARLSSLKVLALARNYLDGTIPDSLDRLTSLETIMLASNRFRCNAPSLEKAHFETPFQGVWYPANELLSEQLATTKDVAPFTLWLAKQAPDTDNVCLIFTGNHWVGTSAAALLNKQAPNSVEHDILRKGDYGLFSGQVCSI